MDTLSDDCRQPLSPKDVCGLIVTHEPLETVQAVVAALRMQTHEVLLFDNSTSPAGRARSAKLVATNVRYFGSGENVGIASALNQLMTKAMDGGYRAVLLCDQDSQISGEVLATLCAVWDATLDLPVAIIGSNARLLGSGKWSAGTMDTSDSAFQSAEMVVFSGSLISVAAFKAIGPFREDFFVDTVDIEWCWRAVHMEWHVLQALKPTMIHGAGQPIRWRLARREIWSVNHRPWRYYYMARNGCILRREYPTKGSWLGYLAALARPLVMEPQRLAKARYIIVGFWDGWHNQVHHPIAVGTRDSSE